MKTRKMSLLGNAVADIILIVIYARDVFQSADSLPVNAIRIMCIAMFVVLGITHVLGAFSPAVRLAAGIDKPEDERDRFIVMKTNAMTLRIVEGVILVCGIVLHFVSSGLGRVELEYAAVALFAVVLLITVIGTVLSMYYQKVL